MRSRRSGASIAILVAAAMVFTMVLVPGTNARVRNTIEFTASAYSVTEGASTTQVELFRNTTGSTASAVVSTTRRGTATAGTDYTAGSVTAVFAATSQWATATIPILVDGVPGESAETVVLKLSSPSEGWGLTSPRTATLTIYEMPKPPAPVLGTPTPANPVVLSWTADSFAYGAVTYSVYRSADPPTGERAVVQLATGLTVLTHTDSTVTAGATYYYWVAARNLDGDISGSNEVSVTVPSAVPAPPDITSVTATAWYDPLGIKIEWTVSAEVAGIAYKIYRGTDGTNFYPVAQVYAITPYYDPASGLVSGTRYYYLVVAINENGTPGGTVTPVSAIAP